MSRIPDLEVTPDAEFATRLERRFLEEAGVAVERKHRRVVEPRRRRYVGGVAAGALLVAAMVVLAMVTIDRDPDAPPVRTVPVTTIAPTTVRATTTAVTVTTSPTTSVESAPSSGPAEPPPHPPYGDMSAGRYSIDTFLVPFVLTTQAPWFRAIGTVDAFVVQRDGTALSVTTRLTEATTPEEVTQLLCPDGIEWLPSVAAGLLGEPAVRTRGTVTLPCEIEVCQSTQIGCSFTLQSGDVIEVTAAVVDGHLVVVASGVASAVTSWDEVEAEIHALVASMEPAS